MHKRLFPKVNEFTYGIYYLALPLSKINASIENKYFKWNRWGLLSFYDVDHGDRNGKDLRQWADTILQDHNILDAQGEIILVTMPRVFGYVFNPVSFWYCYDSQENLRAVICEVNNTFGETHSYVCEYDLNTKDETILEADKVFHVSPFLERVGRYKFRFAMTHKKMGAYINLHDESADKQLITVLTGAFQDLNQKTMRKAFWRYPLVTAKAIVLIHWQAVKLFAKGVRYVPKPPQMEPKVTRTYNSNN